MSALRVSLEAKATALATVMKTEAESERESAAALAAKVASLERQLEMQTEQISRIMMRKSGEIELPPTNSALAAYPTGAIAARLDACGAAEGLMDLSAALRLALQGSRLCHRSAYRPSDRTRYGIRPPYRAEEITPNSR